MSFNSDPPGDVALAGKRPLEHFNERLSPGFERDRRAGTGFLCVVSATRGWRWQGICGPRAGVRCLARGLACVPLVGDGCTQASDRRRQLFNRDDALGTGGLSEDAEHPFGHFFHHHDAACGARTEFIDHGPDSLDDGTA